MNAVDTNVLLYRFDVAEKSKQPIARDLLMNLARQGETVLLWQAAGELLNQLTFWVRNQRISSAELKRCLNEVQTKFPLAMPTSMCLGRALDLADRHMLSHWDSMLLAACLEAGVTTLYTEDMGAPRKIDGLELINPFATNPQAS